MEQETITLEGKPYFIKETESGIFYVVASILIKERVKDNFIASFGFDEEKGELKYGLDIIETPNRNLEIVVEHPYSESIFRYAIQELRKFAEIADQDFVTYEPFGPYIAKYIATEGDTAIAKLRPRIFRKAINN